MVSVFSSYIIVERTFMEVFFNFNDTEDVFCALFSKQMMYNKDKAYILSLKKHTITRKNKTVQGK